MPLLGVHVVKLRKLLTNQQAATASANEELPEEPGLKVIAVIKSSPAAEANILRGDVLMKVGDATVNQQAATASANEELPEEPGLKAVSYTHLDVYKRQA